VTVALIALAALWTADFADRSMATVSPSAAVAVGEMAGARPEAIQYRDIAGLSDEEIRKRYLKDLENSTAFSGEDQGGGIKGFFSL
jgi:hypothetical protein